MASLHRILLTWNGFTGGPGVNVWYGNEGTGLVAQLKTLYDAFALYMPTGVSVSYPQSGDVVDEESGELTGSWSTGAVAPSTGASSGPYTGGAGLCVTWSTDGVVRGRRVRGRTFFVPMGGIVWSGDGTPDNTIVSTLRTSVTNWSAANAGHLVIWSRPVLNAAGGVVAPGSRHSIVGGSITDRSALLRSRRS